VAAEEGDRVHNRRPMLVDPAGLARPAMSFLSSVGSPAIGVILGNALCSLGSRAIP
jgi:hypothetical protein